MNKLVLAALAMGILAPKAENLLDQINPALVPPGPVPDWISPLLGSSAKIGDIDRSLELYVQAKYGNSKPLAEQTDEWLQGIEPWVRTYKSWKKEMAWASDADGNVSLAALHPPVVGSVRPPSISAAQWHVLGPVESFYPVNHDAAQKPNPWIANIYKIEASLSDPNTVYAGGETGHLYKTTNKGLLWNDISYNYAFGGVGALGIHPTNSQIVYVGGGNFVHKSEDGGQTWTRPLNVSGFGINEIELFSQNSSYGVLLASSKGIYRSSDGGANWSQIMNKNCYDLVVNPLNPQVVYAACKLDTTLRIYKSIDAGLSFSNSSNGFDTTHVNNGAVLAMSPADTNYVYATFLGSGANTNASDIQVLRSTDRGANWTVQKTCDLQPSNLASFLNWQGFYNLALAVNPNNVGQIITGTANGHLSLDSGRTMKTVGGFGGYIPLHPDFQDMSVSGNDSWISTDGGITYSSDFFNTAANSGARNKGITGSDFWHFDQGWDEDLIVGGRYHNGNAILSERFGKDTALRFGGAESATGWVLHGQHGAILTDDAGNAVISDQFNGTMKYFNYAKYPGGDGYGSLSSNLLIDPVEYNHHFVGNDSTLWESRDAGLSFSALKKFPNKIRKMAIGRPSGKTIYALAQSQSVLYRTLDGGQTWSELALPGGAAGQNVLLAVNPAQSDELWIINRSGANGSKVYSSTNGGATWTNQTTSVLDGKPLTEITFVPGNPDQIYVYANVSVTLNQVGTKQIQVFHLNKGSSLWEDYSQSLPTASHQMGRALPFYRDAKLRMSTNHGIWESPMADSLIRPVAQVSVPNRNFACSRDTSLLFDYSVAFKPKSWKWSISPAPQYISSETAQRPKIVFGRGGAYRISLKVSDGNGQSDSISVDSAVVLPASSACDVSTSASGSASLLGSPDYSQIPAPNLHTNSLTWMAWVKLDTIQTAYTGIIYSRANGEGRGLIFKDSNALGYDWNGGWGNSSQARVPKNTWTHVALSLNPDSVKVYMNGNVVLAKKGPFSAADFNANLYLGKDPNQNARTMHGLMDEVQIWNRSLSATEIQAKMNYFADLSDPDLLHYYQYSESGTAALYDAAGVAHGSLSRSNARSAENAPVSAKDGIVVIPKVQPMVQAPLNYQFNQGVLELSQLQAGTLKLEVYDASGKLILKNSAWAKTLATDMTKLPAGPVMLRMISDRAMLHRILVLP